MCRRRSELTVEQDPVLVLAPDRGRGLGLGRCRAVSEVLIEVLAFEGCCEDDIEKRAWIYSC